MSSSSPLVLPAVSWPASNAVIGQLQDQLETSPLYMDPETLSQLRLNASSPALLVFRLPYGIGYVHQTQVKSSNHHHVRVVRVPEPKSAVTVCNRLSVCNTPPRRETIITEHPLKT